MKNFNISKSSLIIVFILFSVFYSYSDSNLLATEVSSPADLKGCAYFPLFVGAKWTWKVQGIENVDKITWEIQKAFILNDKSKNLTNILAFKIECNELNQKWYAFEYDGYICFLTESDEAIQRVVPLNPKLEDQWTNKDYSYNVAAIEDNMVKVEFINEDASKYGYFMFVKDIGPYEKFDYEISGENNKDIKMTVTDNIDYKNIGKQDIAKTDNDNTKTDTSKSNTDNNKSTDNSNKITTNNKATTDNKTSNNDNSKIVANDNKTQAEIPESDFIKKLESNKKYIQLGAFNMMFNAKEILDKAKSAGYNTKAFKDSDGYFKILIITENTDNIQDILKKIRDTLTKDAYLKSVKK